MAPKKCFNGFALFMSETKQALAKNGIKMKMADMPDYCKKDWEKMLAEEKETYKMRAKKCRKFPVEKYTSVGEKVEDVKRQIQEKKSQSDAMYLYIEELVRMPPADHYLPKHKFILIHINAYSCDREGFYFPAEISMAEFSLEKGLIRIFHQLVGFDSVKSKAPSAVAADIHTHAKNFHQIGPYTKLSCEYMKILLKIIGFIMNRDVDENVLYDPNIDIPPIYAAHTSTGKELMITSLSLFYLYQSVVEFADRNDLNRLLSVYHLDKLFMEMKNVSYKIQNPNKVEKALPSVAMATDSLSKDMNYSFIDIGCNYHEKLSRSHVCSNYYVCQWIYVLSIHCCQYFNIKRMPGCHYDFDLSSVETTRLEEAIDNLNISKSDCIFDNVTQKEVEPLTACNFPGLEGESVIVQRPIWRRHEHKVNSVEEIVSVQDKNFPLLGNAQKVALKTPLIIGKNKWRSNANPPLDNYQKVTPEIFPAVVGVNSWRSNAHSQKTTPDSFCEVEKNWRANATNVFGKPPKVTTESSSLTGMNSWRSNRGNKH